MLSRTLVTKVALGILALGTATALADADRQGRPNGYIPWHGDGFASVSPYSPTASQPQVINLAPAMGQAAFADAEFDNRWSGLQVIIDRARKDFQISSEYVSARNQVEESQKTFDAATEIVLARLQNDAQYRDLIQRRTEEQIALKSTGVGTGLRSAVATQKMQYGALASDMEAVALANDATVRDAKARLTSAQENLSLKEKQFESQLYHSAEIVAARQQMELARANKAGAEGYLHGAEITRVDQINLNNQTYSGNSVYLGSWGPYCRGYYGVGSFQ